MVTLPLRSLLFVPASRAGAVEQALGSGADAVILDLEDTVPPAEKEAARIAAADLVAKNAGSVLYVRINPLVSRSGASLALGLRDVSRVVAPGLAGVVLPKAETAEDVERLDAALRGAEQAAGIGPGTVEIVPLVETARGLWDCWAVMTASPRVRRVAFGSVDFTRDLGVAPSREGTEVLYARSRLVVASRAAGKEPPLDTVYLHLDDEEGLDRDARLARQLGFQGKLAIHPRQVGVLNEVFSPSPAEVARARRVVSAFAEAEARGEGSVFVDGAFVDYPVVEAARRVLALAHALGRGEAAE